MLLAPWNCQTNRQLSHTSVLLLEENKFYKFRSLGLPSIRIPPLDHGMAGHFPRAGSLSIDGAPESGPVFTAENREEVAASQNLQGEGGNVLWSLVHIQPCVVGAEKLVYPKTRMTL